MAKKAGVRAKFIDMVFDDFSADDLIDFIKANSPTLVGFAAFTTHIKAVGYLAGKIRSAAPNTKLCVGGPHASAMPLATLEEFPAFDFVVCGETKNILIPILDSLDSDEALGKIKGVV